MAIEKNKTYGLDDIELIPAIISDIKHREECDVYNEDNMLPIFTAPMSSVVSVENYDLFNNCGINTIIPRNIDLEIRISHINKTFVTMSLSEFSAYIESLQETFSLEETYYICIDIANGHMKKLLEECSRAKTLFGGNLIIMAGNIANPLTYLEYAKCGIDFIRVGIGGGSACITSVQSGVHYGQATLINEVAKLKEKVINDWDTHQYKSIPYIVADGGFNSYGKIVKALALGADYVMIGKLFAECEEACGDIFTQHKAHDTWTEEDKKNLIWDDTSGTYYIKLRAYYGMSTKRAQKEFGSTKLKTSEGSEFYVYVKYTLPQLVDNIVSYLKTAMSYTNSHNLEEFKNTQYNISSINEFRAYDK